MADAVEPRSFRTDFLAEDTSHDIFERQGVEKEVVERYPVTVRRMARAWGSEAVL